MSSGPANLANGGSGVLGAPVTLTAPLDLPGKPTKDDLRTVLPVPTGPTPFSLAQSGTASRTSATDVKEVKIGDTSIILVAPSGQCELREDRPDEAEVVNVIRYPMRLNELLAVYADCRRLADNRSGKKSALGDMADYMVPKEAMNMQMPPDAAKYLCAEMSKGMGMTELRNVQSRVKEVLKGIEVGEPRSLGVVAEDETACYTAMVQKIEADLTMVLMASLVVRGKLLYYYLSSSYVSDATVQTLLAKHKNNVAAVLRANN
jgi:hypothetical protein